MIEQTLEKYIGLFRKLNRGYNKGLGKAPHKPISIAFNYSINPEWAYQFK